VSGATQKLLEVSEIPAAELACRILEAFHGMKRPVGLTAEQTIAVLDLVDQQMAMRAASAAMGFIAECLGAAKVVQ
jgi:hypothetical protein